MPESSPPSQSADKYIVRLPDGMREHLKQAAAKNKRSLNAEIVARLQESIEASAAADKLPKTKAEVDALAEKLIQSLAERGWTPQSLHGATRHSDLKTPAPKKAANKRP